MTTITLSPDFRYVIYVVCLSVLLMVVKGLLASKGRRKYGVPYPDQYAVKGVTRRKPLNVLGAASGAKKSDDVPLLTDEEVDAYNCFQRQHYNTLENYPQFLVLLILGGLHDGKTSAIGGCVWLVSRLCYALGYTLMGPNWRVVGSFYMVGMLICLYNTLQFAWSLA
mmetsp:Transcript_63878/g.152342  ORF Transcript_63878/g.152342 Transcript_63878/m.152342 type:complete len:167 (+) Transcript_63878:87-587(+)